MNKGFDGKQITSSTSNRRATTIGTAGFTLLSDYWDGGNAPTPGDGGFQPPTLEPPTKPGASDFLTTWFGDKLSPNLGELSLLVPLLSSIRGGKYAPQVRQTMMGVAAAQFGWQTYKRGRDWYIKWSHRNDSPEEKSYIVFLEASGGVARAIISASQKQAAPTAKKNSHVLELRGGYEVVNENDDDASEVVKFVSKFQPDLELQPMRLQFENFTYTLSVQTGKPGAGPKQDSEDDPNQYVGNLNDRYKSYLHIICKGEAAVEALARFMQSLFPERVSEPEQYRSDLYTYDSKSSSWDNAYGSVSRNMDSVVLAKGQAEMILDDIDNFLELEQDYLDYGVTWRRGILLYGPPGGGKTSFVTAMATRMEMDIYYIGLRDIDSNEHLNKAVRSVRPRSVIVFEDVDVVVPKRSTKKSDGSVNGVTLDALLNIMDGMMTPHGALFVLTTNEIDKLDPALLRPGRIDLKVEIGYLTDYQAQTMVERFLGRSVELPEIQHEIMPAALSGIFKKYLHSRDEAYPEIVALITGELDPSTIEAS